MRSYENNPLMNQNRQVRITRFIEERETYEGIAEFNSEEIIVFIEERILPKKFMFFKKSLEIGEVLVCKIEWTGTDNVWNATFIHD